VAQRQLAGLRPQAVYELLVDNDAIGPLTVMARVTAAVKTVRYGDRSFSYDLQVTAPDPVKYGAQVVRDGGFVVGYARRGPGVSARLPRRLWQFRRV